MGECSVGAGDGVFGTDGKTSFWDTLVSTRVGKLPKRDLMGEPGPKIIKV